MDQQRRRVILDSRRWKTQFDIKDDTCGVETFIWDLLIVEFPNTPCMPYIYIGVVFGVNVGKYGIHGVSGIVDMFIFRYLGLPFFPTPS